MCLEMKYVKVSNTTRFFSKVTQVVKANFSNYFFDINQANWNNNFSSNLSFDVVYLAF